MKDLTKNELDLVIPGKMSALSKREGSLFHVAWKVQGRQLGLRSCTVVK